MDNNTVFRIQESVEFDLGEGLLIIPVDNSTVDTSKTLYLEKVSLEIWKCIKEGKRIGNIIDILSSKYEIDRDTITSDVYEFVNNIYGRGYIDIHN